MEALQILKTSTHDINREFYTPEMLKCYAATQKKHILEVRTIRNSETKEIYLEVRLASEAASR